MKLAGSLFVRLLVAQLLLVVILTLLLAALFYAERNRTVAQLVASRWAPALKLAAQGAPADDVYKLAPAPLRFASMPPEREFHVASLTPRMLMVREALLDDGVPLTDALFGRVGEADIAPLQLWVGLRQVDGGTRWIGFASPLIDPLLRERVVIMIVLLVCLAVAASAVISRHLSRPLETLRTRIASNDAAGGPLANASTEVLAIDEAWRALRRSLDQSERERALLLAGVSHDLRSPLGRIRMAAELLPREGKVEQRREVIVRNVALADRLVGNFLDHVRSGELSLEEVVDLAALARAAADQQEGRSSLVVEAPESLVVPGVNAVLLERVVANLLDNAFTHGASPVVLRVAELDGHARIEVEDHGPGIAPELQEAMLQAFARGDSSRGSPGLGLGLAIVQRVAARLGGHVRFLKSTDGSRSVVRVEWPIVNG